MKINLSDIHNQTSYRLPATFAVFILLALPAGAQTVLNHSFEESTLADGTISQGLDIPQWTHLSSFGTSSFAVFNPNNTWLSGTDANGTASGADGTNVFSTYNPPVESPKPVNYSGVYQVITGTPLTAGTTYTLTVAIGDYTNNLANDWRLAISTSSMAFGTFLINRTGSATLLTNDQFKDFTVTYTATGAEPQIGENLKITLWSVNSGSGTHVPFDNVRFTAVAGPVLATFSVTITPTANPDFYDFTWPSQDGKVYDLVSSTNLSTPPANWDIWHSNQSIDPTEDIHTLENVYGGDDTKRFFSVIERDP